jgi:putative transposase
MMDGAPQSRQEDAVARPTSQQWETALDRLRELTARKESITAEVAATAARLGVTDRTVWRRLSCPPRPRLRFALSPTDIAAFSDFGGNVAAVYRAREAAIAGRTTVCGVPIDPALLRGWAGAPPVARRSLYRAFAEELTPAFVAGVTGGERARRAKLVYLRRPATFRNQVWEGDHKNLPIVVLPPRGKAVTPWVTMFIDDATRLITGWAIALTPHAGTVLTALRMGMIDDPATGPAHGVPGLLRLDRGLEFAAASVRAATGALGTECQRLPGYQPNKKGKIERAFLTMEQMLLCTLPGYTGAAREVDGRLVGPVDDRARAREEYGQAAEAGADTVLPLGLETFAAIFGDWVRSYNTEHSHSELDGRTPARAWAEDPSPVIDVPELQLRHLLLASEPRTIGPQGVRFKNLTWVDPGGAIRERRGQQVVIRYMPHDDRQIHVYLNGEFLATCHPRDALTGEQEEQFYAAARAQERQAARQRAAARHRGRRRLVALSAGQDAAESARRIPAAQVEHVTRAPADLRAESSASLLNLGPIGPIEPVDLAYLDVREQGRPW